MSYTIDTITKFIPNYRKFDHNDYINILQRADIPMSGQLNDVIDVPETSDVNISDNDFEEEEECILTLQQEIDEAKRVGEPNEKCNDMIECHGCELCVNMYDSYRCKSCESSVKLNYGNNSSRCNNCTCVHDSTNCNHSINVYNSFGCDYSNDINMCFKCEYSSNCLNCLGCYACRNCVNCVDCRGCVNCFNCIGLNNCSNMNGQNQF